MQEVCDPQQWSSDGLLFQEVLLCEENPDWSTRIDHGRNIENHMTRDREMRDRLAAGARQSAEEGFAPDVFDRELQRIWRTVWNESF